jgi:gluconolactonase
LAFHPSSLATDLRSFNDGDSKPNQKETQQREQQMSDASHRPGWQPATYYPDPAIHAVDPRFEKYWLKLSAIERLATGLRWGEGPVWFGDGRYLLCSDIPNNRILKWEEETGAVSIFRKPSNFANGHTRDRQGRLVGCEHGGRRVVRTEYDGSITVLMDSFEGKRLNSPNDVVVKSDGSIWFTDPVFGLLGNYEGYKAESEINPNIYRIDGNTGLATIVADDVLGPNGLCFSPDEKILYVVESRGVPNRKILAYDMSADGKTISNKRIHIDAGPGTPDGMRCDIDGNLWCGWGMGDPELDGVFVFAPDGAQIGRIALPERCANLCFGGLKRNRLFMASSQSIYALYVNTQGALGG